MYWALPFNSHCIDEETKGQRKDAQVGNVEPVVGHRQSGPRVLVRNAVLYNLTGMVIVNTKPYLSTIYSMSGRVSRH